MSDSDCYVTGNNSGEDIIRKAKLLNKFKPPDLEVNFSNDETTPLKQSESKEDVEQSHHTPVTDQSKQTPVDEKIDQTPVTEQSNQTPVPEEAGQKLEEYNSTSGSTIVELLESTKPELSLHDQLAISLERQMQIIEAQEDTAKARMSAQTTLQEVFTTRGETLYDNITHPVVKQISEFAYKYKDDTKVRSLSEELAEHDRIVEDMQQIVDQNSTEAAAEINLENRTFNTDNIRYQWERKASGQEEDLTTRSLADQMEYIHHCMNQQKYLHDGDFTTTPNDEPNRTNRIEKRSIPNTNPELHEDGQKVTTGDRTSDIEELSEHKNESIEYLKNIFPGVNKFWEVFVTSPVEVILNSTDVYGQEVYMSTMQDYEKAYYEKLVKSLKENHQTHEPSFASDSSDDTDEERESHTKKTRSHTEQIITEKYDISKELSEMLGHFENPTSLEKNVARKLLEKKKKGPTTRDPKDSLSPEKYARFMELKKSLDEQYKDIIKHMNQTDQDVQRLFFEMRNLKEEKAINDYYEQNEQHYSHFFTPANYTETLLYLDGEPFIPTDNPFSSENASDIMPDGIVTPHHEGREDSVLSHQVLDDTNDFIIKTAPQEEFNSRLREIYYGTVQTKGTEFNFHIDTTKNTEKINYESLERYDKKRFRENLKMEVKEDVTIIPNINDEHLKFVHENLLKRLNKTKSSESRRTPTTANTESPKPWFEESVFDRNDPKILYAKYLHNVRNMSVKLNMEVGKKHIKNITHFNQEDRLYAHQYKTTTECRRFSHIIPFWLTQPKEIEEVFKGNTKIFREYIQYILDKHNFTELPVHGRFAFLRRYINKLNNPLIFNRITIFPTAYVTTDHVLSLKEQILHFKGHMKSKIHKAYKHVKHFLFNSSLDEAHDPAVITNTEPIPEEVIINITTPPPMGPYYDYY